MAGILVRRMEKQRLVYYRAAADAAFWAQHWHQNLSHDTYHSARQGGLDWFEVPFTRYLPKEGRILEAGCGPGQYVLALRVRGYEVEGVDWASETVKAVQSLYPDLPIRQGDATRLKAPDGYYRGYISLGVVEHLKEGPEPFLREAYRVLKVGGVALISVPCFHRLRRLKARLGLYRGRYDDLEFYQYAFTESEFSTILRLANFRVIDHMLYDGFKGVKDEIPPLRWIVKWRGIGWCLQRWLQSWQWAERNLGHMVLFICEKAE